MSMLKIEDIHVYYGAIHAVKNVSFEVGEGEIVALIGANGAGKSTILKTVSGLMHPRQGSITFGGENITHIDSDKLLPKGLAHVPEGRRIFLQMTVQENLELMCGVHGFTREKQMQKVRQIAEELGLGNILKRKAGKLSGGWQRRLSIAMALIGEPEILFLDEPTLGLDVLARSDLWEVIRALKGKRTIILTTHYMEEAEALSDEIGIMKDGRLLALGTAQALKERAGTERFEDAFVAIVKGAAK